MYSNGQAARPRLDLEHLGSAEQVAERADQPRWITHHLSESVHALDLRGEQVVARAAADRRVPRDTQLGEQPQRRRADLGQQGVVSELGRQGKKS